MRALRPLVVVAAAAALWVSAPPVSSGDEKDDEKRWDELVERLRKAEPKEEAEVVRKKANDRLVELLGKAEDMELLRLDPRGVDGERAGQGKLFHGYEVILRKSIKSVDQRAELVKSLGRELFWSDLVKAPCFRPRHGFRATVGKETLDLVICLECHRMKVYRDGRSEGEVSLLGPKWVSAEKVLGEAKTK